MSGLGEVVTERKTEFLPVQLVIRANRRKLDLGRPLGHREGRGPMRRKQLELFAGPLLSLLVGAKRYADAVATDRGLSPPSLSQDTQCTRKVIVPRKEDEGRKEVVRLEVWNGVVHDGVEDALGQCRPPAEPEALAELAPWERFGTETALSRPEEDVDRRDGLVRVDLDGFVAVATAGSYGCGVCKQAAVPAYYGMNRVSTSTLKSMSTVQYFHDSRYRPEAVDHGGSQVECQCLVTSRDHHHILPPPLPAVDVVRVERIDDRVS